MKKRLATALALAWLAWPLVAGNLPAAQPRGADWSRPRTMETERIKARYPRAWHASRVDGGGIVIQSGMTRISVWNFGALEHTDGFPQRPDHFALDEDDRHFSLS